jgi:alginate O-acetyltransferase complex protein AlgI
VLFNSYLFIFVFLPIVLVGFYVLRRQPLRLLFLISASYFFYAHARWWFPALMLGSTAMSFVGGRAVAAAPTALRKKLALATGIVGCLALLAFFKYLGFSAYYGSKFLTGLTGTGLPGLQAFAKNVVLPVGISFYTFEAISYMVDVYRGTVQVERNPLRYAFFISFFPHLIAGPIVRYGKLQPQLDRFSRFDLEQFRSGLLLFSLGLVKKVLLADGISQHIDPTLNHTASMTALQAWTAMIGFSFQIYFDFSGYTDMALGLARMVGIELPWNFDRPYRAASPREFWRRWHVTLSTWLRDYLYIPLGGSRKGGLRRDANLLATMGLGGLWHGASLNFVIWGFYQGGLLVGNHHLGRLPVRVPKVVGIGVTYLLVVVGWVFFRFRDFADVKHVFRAMLGQHGIGSPISGLVPFLVVSAIMMWGLPEEWKFDLKRWGVARVAAVGVLVAFVMVAMNQTQKFLYFQF